MFEEPVHNGEQHGQPLRSACLLYGGRGCRLLSGTELLHQLQYMIQEFKGPFQVMKSYLDKSYLDMARLLVRGLRRGAF